MSNDSWKKGTKDVQQGKGAPKPSSFPSTTQKESYNAGRAAEERRRQQQQQLEQQKKNIKKK